MWEKVENRKCLKLKIYNHFRLKLPFSASASIVTRRFVVVNSFEIWYFTTWRARKKYAKLRLHHRHRLRAIPNRRAALQRLGASKSIGISESSSGNRAVRVRRKPWEKRTSINLTRRHLLASIHIRRRCVQNWYRPVSKKLREACLQHRGQRTSIILRQKWPRRRQN